MYVMKPVHQEIRINARKLSTPGPRLMAENAIGDQHPGVVRIIVSSDDAARDVAAYLQGRGAEVRTDILGEDIHVIAHFPPVAAPSRPQETNSEER